MSGDRRLEDIQDDLGVSFGGVKFQSRALSDVNGLRAVLAEFFGEISYAVAQEDGMSFIAGGAGSS